MGITAHMPWKFRVPAGFGVHHVMNPDPYKGLFGGANCRDCVVACDRQCDCKANACKAEDAYMQQLDEVKHFMLSF